MMRGGGGGEAGDAGEGVGHPSKYEARHPFPKLGHKKMRPDILPNIALVQCKPPFCSAMKCWSFDLQRDPNCFLGFSLSIFCPNSPILEIWIFSGFIYPVKEEEEEGPTPSLTRFQVSYLFYNLESHLSNLLLCFSLFPEKAIINKRQIIYRWIGEGLVETSDPSRDLEVIAEDLFKELIHKGLIEPVKKRGAVYHNPVVKSCRMHPTIHKHVTEHAKQQGYFDSHSCLTKKKDNEGGPSRQSELKTLLNLDARYLKLDKSWFSAKEKLMVLQLGRWKREVEHHIELIGDTDLMEKLGQLKNLRCLSFKGVSSITKLPDCLGELVNLIILDLRACHNLESLTTRIALLKKLTHLDVSECYLLDNIPEELAQLSELRVLKGFILGQTQRAKRSCKLSDLGKLKKLRKLSINITKNGNAWSSRGEELRQLSSLCSLTITWARVPSKQKEVEVSDDFTMESFPFPIQNLEKLDLWCLPTEHPPKWLEPNTLGGLKKLYIRGGQLKRLPLKPKTTWVKLEVLRLKCLKKLDEDIDLSEQREVFPKLIYLEVFQCDKTSSKDRVWGFGKAN